MKKEHVKSESKPLRGVSSIHISISSPLRLRKEVLSLAIEAIQLLKHNERLKLLKKRKLELMGRLKHEMDGIRKLMLELNTSDLPLSLEEVRNHPRFKVDDKPAKEHEVVHHGTVASKKPHHEALKEHVLVTTPKVKDKLEEDLEDLQRKLADL